MALGLDSEHFLVNLQASPGSVTEWATVTLALGPPAAAAARRRAAAAAAGCCVPVASCFTFRVKPEHVTSLSPATSGYPIEVFTRYIPGTYQVYPILRFLPGIQVYTRYINVNLNSQLSSV